MRILVANVAAAERGQQEGRIFKTLGVPVRRSFSLAQQPDTEVVFRFPRRVSSNLDAQPYNYLHSLADVEILHMLTG